MNMRMFLATAVLIATCIVPTIARTENFDAQIEAVQQAYRDAQGLKADFTQKTFVKLIEKEVLKKGVLYYKRGGKFKIEYAGKDEKNYVCDGAMLWVFVTGDEASIMTYKVNDETVPREALSFLSGFDNLRRDFKIAPSKTFTELKEGESAMLLTPKSRKAQFAALDAKFNANHLLEDLTIHNNSGNISEYHFTKITTAAPLKDALFTYGSGKATPATAPQ